MIQSLGLIDLFCQILDQMFDIHDLEMVTFGEFSDFQMAKRAQNFAFSDVKLEGLSVMMDYV